MLKLLIVEDVEIVRNTLARQIDWASLGLELAGAAEEGEQALEMMEQEVPDLLVTDIGMPVMDGIELIRHVKSMYPGIKCIILSGLNEFKYAQEAIKLGVVDYVLKPIDVEELSDVVRRTVHAIREERKQYQQVKKAKEMMKEKLPHVAGEDPALTDLTGSLKNRKIADQIIGFIHANLSSSTISQQQIAAQVNLSEKYVNSIFKNITGMTINHYIIAHKMELAARLLKDPNIKVYEVCDRVGYSDKDHFRESFKKHHGCTPSEYKNNYL